MNHHDRSVNLSDRALSINPDQYAENPEYLSHLKPRIHKNAQTADDASIQCQIDLLGRENLGTFTGSMNPISGNSSALMFPYTLPENFALVAYMCEAAAVADDIEDRFLSSKTIQKLEAAGLQHATTPAQALLAGFDQSIIERIEQTASKIMLQLSNRGNLGEGQFSSWDPWKRVSRSAKSRSNSIEYRDLRHYLSERRNDFGWQHLTTLAHFGAGISLTSDEKLASEAILEPLYDSVILSNDYFSWGVDSSRKTGQSRVVNCVALFMQLYRLCEEDAKKSTKVKIIELEKEYLTRKMKYLQTSHGGQVSRLVLDSLGVTEAIAAGFALWNITCPRYHPPGGNVYEAYYKSRIEDGFRFFDSCTDSDKIIYCDIGPYQANGGNLKQEIVKGDFKNGSTEITGRAPAHFKDIDLDPLGLEVLRYPSDYIMTMPGKGVREAVLNAMNLWYRIPQESLEKIKSIVKLTHTSSLMFDDVQDNSPLRRGKPSAHKIFGVGHAISSGFFLCLDGLRLVQELSEPAMTIYLDELDSMHRGQAYDLYWTQNGMIPTEREYLSMIDAKTSALFRLASRLSRAEATTNKELELERRFTLMGRYFQIRDDYQNLTSSEYIDNKGFCEDLDEGKYSLLLIHALQKGDPLIQSILQQRKISGGLTMEMKQVVLERLKSHGSFEYTWTVLKELYSLIMEDLDALERETKVKNWVLRRILQQLKV